MGVISDEVVRRVKAHRDAHHLSAAERKKIPRALFAIPERRAYPIDTLARARNALARVAQYGTDDEKIRVPRAVYRNWPQIDRKEKTK